MTTQRKRPTPIQAPPSGKPASSRRRDPLVLLALDAVTIERLLSDRAGLVQAALADGATWAEIGQAIGITRQAAHQAYRDVQLRFHQ